MGSKPEYAQAAAQLGGLLAELQIELVYGGSNVGLMKILADAVLAAGGEVTGVIPNSFVEREIAHPGLSRLEMVPSMHARKARMAELASAFIALPGGLGTFDELFEILTWRQLGFHSKPVALLNTLDYFNPLIQLCEHATAEGFIRTTNLPPWTVHSTPEQVLESFTQLRF